ncbi:MAG: PAS domain-containing protein [Gemmataceae bacterium]
MPPSEADTHVQLALRHAFHASPDALVVCALPSLEVLHANAAARGLGVEGGRPLAGMLLPEPDWDDDPAARLGWLSRPGHAPVAVEVRPSRVPGSDPPLGLLRLTLLGAGWLERLASGTLALLAVRDGDGRLLYATPRSRAVPADAGGEAPVGELVYLLEDHPVTSGIRLTLGVEVSPRRQAEDDDHHRAELYRLLLNSTDDFLGVVDRREDRLYVNPAFYRATGYTPEEVEATDFRTRVHPDDLPLVERARQANLRGERTRIEYRCRCKNGSYLWLDLRATPVPGTDGRVERVVWASRDITDRKRLEQELRDSRRFIEHVADMLPQMLFVYDLTEGRHVWVNARCAEVRGYTAGEMLRMGPGEAAGHIHPDDRLEEAEAVRRLEALRDNEVLDLRYRVMHRTKGYLLVRTRCVAFRRGDDGRPSQVLGVCEAVEAQPGPGVGTSFPVESSPPNRSIMQ